MAWFRKAVNDGNPEATGSNPNRPPSRQGSNPNRPTEGVTMESFTFPETVNLGRDPGGMGIEETLF